MANIKINSIPTRVQYTATSGQTVFSYTFPIKADSDLKVYKRASGSEPDDDTDILVLTTNYTVTGANTANGGTVVLVVGATTGDIVTIVGDKTIDRTAIYDQSVTLKKADLNNDFNDNVMYDKQIETIQNQLTPKYNRSELIGPAVRQDNLVLPILNDNEIWVGRGNYGDSPDDIIKYDLDNLLPPGVLNADFVIGTANAGLPNAQVLGSLGEGIMYNTPSAGTGTVSILNIGAGLALDTATDTLSSTGGGAVLVKVTQAGHGFAVGDWLYRDSGTYALAKADNATTTEEVGLVVEVIDADNFMLQQSGFVDGLLAGLTDSTLYWLSPSSAGDMTATKPTDPTHYTKPLFVATDTDSGWILSHRALAVLDEDDPDVEIISQVAHGLVFGDFVRRDTGSYIKAQADSAANAEVIGMVVGVPDADTFLIQQVGYVKDISTATWAPTVDATVYFLSETTAGEATSTEPSVSGEVSKPVFVADGTGSGWILHYRGMVVGTGGGGGGTNGMVKLATVDATGLSFALFDNILDATYTKYMLVGENIVAASSGTYLYLQFGYGATPTYDTTAANYVTELLTNGTGGGYPAGTYGFHVLNSTSRAWAPVSNYTGSLNIILANTQDSTNAKGITGHVSVVTNSSTSQLDSCPVAGCWLRASTATSIRLGWNGGAGTFTAGTFTLYGLS